MPGDYRPSSNPFGGEEIPWSEALPTVADCRIEVRQSMGSARVVNWNQMNGRVECENSLCRRGWVDIGGMLRAAVAEGTATFEQRALCVGTEPMGRRHSRPCTNFYSVTGTITYKPNGTLGNT